MTTLEYTIKTELYTGRAITMDLEVYIELDALAHNSQPVYTVKGHNYAVSFTYMETHALTREEIEQINLIAEDHSNDDHSQAIEKLLEPTERD